MTDPVFGDATPRLSLPFIAPGQAQKHVTLNEALSRLDALVQAAALSRATAAQPAAPGEGDAYVLPAGATGPAWAGQPAGTLMRFDSGAWVVAPAPVGAVLYVVDEARLLVRDAAGWAPVGEETARLGIGTAASAANPLTAKLNAALFTARTAAEGGTGALRLALNKGAASEVLSLLFQVGFSGRAELGLIGDERFGLKLSADGAAWTVALQADAAGRVRLPAQPGFGQYVSAVRTSSGACAGYQPQFGAFNRGGFDPVGGVFTAPAGGVYQVNAILKRLAPVEARGILQLHANGTLVAELVETWGPYQDAGAATVLQLSAGDALHLGWQQVSPADQAQAVFGAAFLG